MKKIIKNPVLILVLAAMLTMTGCPSNTPDEEKLPGRWTTATTYWNSTSGTLIGAGPNYTYTSDYAEAEKKFKDDADAESGNFYTSPFYVTGPDDSFTGFQATASSTPKWSPYGFCFNVTQNWEKFYLLIIQDNTFKVRQYDGQYSDAIPWTKNDAINPAADGNTVTVYTTDKNKTIVIQINDVTVGVIRDPITTAGHCGVVGAITYDEYTSHVPNVSKFKFIKFQY